MTEDQLVEMLKKMDARVEVISDETATYGFDVVLDQWTRDLLAKWLTAVYPELPERVAEIGELSAPELLKQLRSYAENLSAKGSELTYDNFGPPTGTMICEWLDFKGQGMTSAVGEYTPKEFWYLLDTVQGQQRQMERMRDWMESRVSSDSDSPDYLCPAGRVQVGLAAFKDKE